MTEITNRDEWLKDIKERVKAEMKDIKWHDGRWTTFVEDVLWWLKNKQGILIDDTILAAVGLIRLGIRYMGHLDIYRKDSSAKERVIAKLEKDWDLPLVVCELLFVYSPKRDAKRTLEVNEDEVNEGPDAFRLKTARDNLKSPQKLASYYRNTLATPNEGDGLEAPRIDVESIDVSCCKLSADFLNLHGTLKSYADAATTCANNLDVLHMLIQLGDYDKTNYLSQEFSCIVAPSGTGKSQLAATAAQIDAWNVVYFYTGSGGSADSVEEFYKPHVCLRNKLMEAICNFSSFVDIKDTGAATLAQYRGSHPLFQLLLRCFFGKKSTNATMQELQECIRNESKTLLVFLDEVPASVAANNDFNDIILLRNVIRAAGVSPILMSTHADATVVKNRAVKRGSDSRTDYKRWCRVFVKMPKYQSPGSKKLQENPWLCASERPLVAAAMVHEITERQNIATIVDKVQERIQSWKELAWLDHPMLQLCQLIRSMESPIIPGAYNHRIVGYHFGHITQHSECPLEVRRSDAQTWIQNQPIEFVDPEKEHILFLALTSWKLDHVKAESERYFPLVSKDKETSSSPNKRRRLSVRGAFETSPMLFTENFDAGNGKAKKGDGDDLGVLALASMTLASLQSEGGIFDHVKLPTFLANVFHFMGNEPLDVSSMTSTADEIGELLKETSTSIKDFSKVTVPTCPSVGSNFKTPYPDQDVKCGKIERPKDDSGRDGILLPIEPFGNSISVECKNLKGGLTTDVFKKVVGNMTTDSNVSLLFTSNMNRLFATAKNRSSVFVQDDLNLNLHKICFLVLEHGEKPYWLEVGTGEQKLSLKPQEDTEYLMVVIASGTVDPKKESRID